jgi:hypothetical protein
VLKLHIDAIRAEPGRTTPAIKIPDPVVFNIELQFSHLNSALSRILESDQVVFRNSFEVVIHEQKLFFAKGTKKNLYIPT